MTNSQDVIACRQHEAVLLHSGLAREELEAQRADLLGANAALREEVRILREMLERANDDLAGWRKFLMAIAAGDDPWPNDWPQDPAAAAWIVHNLIHREGQQS